MRRSRFAPSVLSLAALALLFGPAAAAARGGEFHLNGHTFTLPDGFELEQAAGPPLVDRPIVADFDEQGRLYVADSSGSNEKVNVQLEKKPHRIVRLEDTDGDGRFDKRTVFADRMMFPEGTLWYDGSLYVSAPPSIWKLTDTDGDGVADQRSEWFQGKTLTGCANDLHGPYLGLDGWIYWAKGAFAQQTYERPGRKPFVTRAAHIFRCRPDGSGIEPVMTGGMDNPVDVVFTPGGERIFTTTFLQIPRDGRRDGLIHAIYGGVYGKVNNATDDHPRTGPDFMPVLAHLGPAAPCGFTSYDSAVFGPEYRDNLFASLFNLQKVTRQVLEPNGATFTARVEDFLVSPDPDRNFHPTDVRDDADGSLIVVDTGGWYKLCCPTSQIPKPDVLGAIYRVRRKGAPKVDDPRGLKLAWETMTPSALVKLLDDPRPAVRQRAIQTLGKQGANAVPALAEAARSGRSPEARRNAVWAATRIEGPAARQVARRALGDADETVRQAAIHSASVRRDGRAFDQLVGLLKSPSAHNRRAAAEALGRLGNSAAVPALLEAASQPADRVLEHSLTFALIELADPGATAAGLKSASTRTRRAALVALDQMEGGGLKVETVAAELDSTDPALKTTAAWIASRHPDWGGALVDRFRQRLAGKAPAAGEADELVHQLGRFARSEPIQQLLAERVGDASASDHVRQIALGAMAASGLRQVPETWSRSLTQVLTGDDPALRRQAVSTVRALLTPRSRPGEIGPALLEVGSRESVPADVRLEALAAIPGGLTRVSPSVFAFLLDQMDPQRPLATRGAAADIVSKARFTRGQLEALLSTITTAGPLELDRVLSAFERTTDEAIGRKLIASLKVAPARSTLRVEALQPRLARFGPAVKEQAEELYTALNVDAAQQKARLESLLGGLSGGDVKRGQAVFNNPKAACVACHTIGYRGGRVGPDLTRIGQIRTERDLLESIVFPSASFVRSFEPMTIATKDGKVYNGVPRQDAPHEVILATGPDQEARIARDEIDEIRPSTVSVMPAGLDQQLSARELADLVAFLKACR
jgi:putative membrane-bound dehydrogenase-like protein